MAKAGYDIRQAPSVWDDFSRALGDHGDSALMSTHPSSSSRKNALQEEIAFMQALGWRPGHAPDAALEATATRRGYFAL